MTILGINSEKLYPVTKPVKFRNIIIPDESFFNESGKRFFTDEYRQTIDRIRSFAKKNLSPTANKKFYLFHGKNRIGEEHIAKFFHSKGYDIVTPGLLTLEEQLNIFANCDELASTVGSISHNLIFLRDNANVILIKRKGIDLNNYQQALNQVHDINVFYIDSALSIFQVASEGPFCYIVSENLRKHFGDEITEKYTEEDFKSFLTYVRHAKNQGLKENKNELEYLRNILPEFIAQLKRRKDLMQQFGIVIK